MLLNEIVDFMKKNNYNAFRSWGETLLDRVGDVITLYSHDYSKEYEFDLDEETDGVERLELVNRILEELSCEVDSESSSSKYMEVLFDMCKSKSDYYILNDGDEVVHAFRTIDDKMSGKDLECITDVGTTYYGHLTSHISYIVEVDNNKIATFTFMENVIPVTKNADRTHNHLLVFRFVEDEEPLTTLKRVLEHIEEERLGVMEKDNNNYKLEDVKEKVKSIKSQIEFLTKQLNDVVSVINSWGE